MPLLFLRPSQQATIKYRQELANVKPLAQAPARLRKETLILISSPDRTFGKTLRRSICDNLLEVSLTIYTNKPLSRAAQENGGTFLAVHSEVYKRET